MQCVILAAGRGARMGHLTDDMPKPLLVVAGKSLLEHKLDALPREVDEIVIIVGYLGEKIRERIGDSYKGVPVRYVEQGVQNGTAGAIWEARSILRGAFLAMNGDDIYGADDLAALAACPEWGMLVSPSEDTSRVARVVADASGRVTGILEEGTHDGAPGFMNAGAYKLDMRLFELTPVPAKTGSDELGLPQTIVSVANTISIEQVTAELWCPVNTQEDLERATALLASMV